MFTDNNTNLTVGFIYFKCTFMVPELLGKPNLRQN